MEEKTKQKSKTLYEYIRSFLDEMKEKFPEGCDDSIVFLLASDGHKISSLIGGDDDVMSDMISYVTLKDDEVRNVVGNALLATINLLSSKSNGTIATA